MKLFYFILAALLLSSCADRNLTSYQTRYSQEKWEDVPNYSKLINWAAHPEKRDPSDSVPADLITNYKPNQMADVFFIHPTTYLDPLAPSGWNAAISNIQINYSTDYRAILNQASIFNEIGKIYAPRYRQAHIKSYYPISSIDTVNAIAAFEMAYKDIKAAFEFYLANYHQNRPIIIASHSQGSTHAKRLLKEFFDNDNALSKKLVTAYIVGMAIDPSEFNRLKACATPTETGCICAWRTYKEGYIPAFVKKEQFVSMVTNPISWDNQVPKKSRMENQGAVIYNFNKVIPKVAGAITHGGVLWTAKPRFFGSIFYNTKNYHIADYNLYYMSIRNNVANRVDQFFKNENIGGH